MYILGLETSCDETAAAVLSVDDTGVVKVLANIVASQIVLHASYGGVVPSLAAREHIKNLNPVLEAALKKADQPKLDLIAVTSGPGLISSLLVGTTFAQTYAWRKKLPILGVNHIEGHIYSNWLTPLTETNSSQLPIISTSELIDLPQFEARLSTVRQLAERCTGQYTGVRNGSRNKEMGQIRELRFPAVCLIVSGGHTELILMQGHGDYQLIGRTRDDAAGEAFDKIARILELGYPGGPAIAERAKVFETSGKNKLGIKLPRPMLNISTFDFSFSGLKTAVLYLVRDLLTDHKLEEIRDEIAHETQEAIVETLVNKTMRAAQKYEAASVILAGGVSANQRLREYLCKHAQGENIPLILPDPVYTTDNAAMIAMAGYQKFKNQKSKIKIEEEYHWSKIKADANWELV